MRAPRERRRESRRTARILPPQYDAWTGLEQRAVDVQAGITRWLHVGETFVLIAVALILLATGIVVAFDALHTLVAALGNLGANSTDPVISIAEDALLALILVELVRTLLIPSHGGTLAVEPFLVVAIVAVVRKVILLPALDKGPMMSGGLVSAQTAELLGLALVILILGIVLALLRRFRSDA
jgi:uncharacterized membrane protein (DUF373 family)